MSVWSGARQNGSAFSMGRGTAPEAPALGTRLRARLQRLSLDHRIATGEPTWASPELRWRAAELTSPRERRRVADEIEGLLETAAQPPRPPAAAVPLNRTGVLTCAGLLCELEDDLRHAESVQAHGVARVRQLLRDGRSPLYAPAAEGELDRSIRHARAALLLH